MLFSEMFTVCSVSAVLHGASDTEGAHKLLRLGVRLHEVYDSQPAARQLALLARLPALLLI